MASAGKHPALNMAHLAFIYYCVPVVESPCDICRCTCINNANNLATAKFACLINLAHTACKVSDVCMYVLHVARTDHSAVLRRPRCSTACREMPTLIRPCVPRESAFSV